MTQQPTSKFIEDLKARKGIHATEKGIRERYSHVFNPMINEGFFGDKVVIVEGPSEQYALPIYADALDVNFDKNNISIVHNHGKGDMDRLLRVFNGFEIPTYLWFDGDKNNENTAMKKKTLELLNLLGNEITKIEAVCTIVSDKYTVLESKFEDTLKKELKDYDILTQQAVQELGPSLGKPLKHRFIADKLKQKINEGESPQAVLPGTIIKIVNKIRKLEYYGTVFLTDKS